MFEQVDSLTCFHSIRPNHAEKGLSPLWPVYLPCGSSCPALHGISISKSKDGEGIRGRASTNTSIKAYPAEAKAGEAAVPGPAGEAKIEASLAAANKAYPFPGTTADQ
jgi:hypothetical protein|nr:hypothetical protein Q903MT_gene4534 [Picea sitchensis]